MREHGAVVVSHAESTLGTSLIRVFDPQAFRDALDEDDFDDGGFLGPADERPCPPARSRTVEDEVWARLLRKIIADPLEGQRRRLIGSADMVRRLRRATETMPHFSVVVGIIERAVLASARTGTTIRFPPILMLSEPGFGKTHFARAVGSALGTSAVSIALNATSDRGQIGGQSPAWRGAKLGKFAKTILFDCESASPLFLLDEVDKCTKIAGENVASILLSALEPENAAAFVDEYVDVPIRLDGALWLASANDTEAIAPPLLSRFLIVEVPKPSEEQARIVVHAIASAAVGCAIDDDAVDLMLAVSARKARQAIEVAHPMTVCAGRKTICADDVRRALALVDGRPRRPAVGFTR